MSSTVARLLLVSVLFVAVASYSVLSDSDRELLQQSDSAPRFWPSIPEYLEESEVDGRIKRGLDDIEQQLSKRTNLKRLVILSARGFGRK